MKTLRFTILINAPKQKVWEVMLDDETYRVWAAVFMPGSHFVGGWGQGEKIQFLSANESGKTSGMTSKIVENRPHEFISIKHLGVVADGVEDTTSEEAKRWVGFENYSFRESEGQTELTIMLETPDDFAEYMNQEWPKALAKIKELAENEE